MLCLLSTKQSWIDVLARIGLASFSFPHWVLFQSITLFGLVVFIWIFWSSSIVLFSSNSFMMSYLSSCYPFQIDKILGKHLLVVRKWQLFNECTHSLPRMTLYDEGVLIINKSTNLVLTLVATGCFTQKSEVLCCLLKPIKDVWNTSSFSFPMPIYVKASRKMMYAELLSSIMICQTRQFMMTSSTIKASWYRHDTPLQSLWVKMIGKFSRVEIRFTVWNMNSRV